jgi:hypothetical protein
MTNTVKLTYGLGNSITNSELAGFTLGELRRSRQAQALGIPSDATYYKGTAALGDNYVIQAGDEISAEARAANKAA